MSTILTDAEAEQFSIEPDSNFANAVNTINHPSASSIEATLRQAIEVYNETEDDYPISLKNITEKAKAVHEILSRSRAVLVETSPGLVKATCGKEDDDYGRFEPFFVAYPEYVSSGQMLFRSMAALSEVYHQIRTRDRYLEGDLAPESDSEYTPEEAAARAEKDAFTRYQLDSFYDAESDPDHDGDYFDKGVIDAIHVDKSPIRNSLLIGSNNDGLYAGRGNLSEGDVTIGLDRLITDDKYANKKVEIHSEYKHRNAFASLSLPDTGALYNSHYYGKWEVDLSCLGTVINDLATHDEISLIGVHPITEAAYRREHNANFGEDIDGYDA